MKSRFTATAARTLATFMIAAAMLYAYPASSATWSTPKTLNSFTLTALPTNTAAIATAPNGDAIAVWTNEVNGSVQYAQQTQGVWAAAKVLYRASTTKGETTSGAHVAIGPDGTATAVFGSTTPGPLQYCVYGLRVYRCKGPDTSYAKVTKLVPGATAWTIATNLSPLGIIVSDTQIAADVTGNLVALWRLVSTAGAPSALQWSEQRIGATWSAPLTLSTSASAPLLPALAVGASGDAAVVWAEKTASTTLPYAIRSMFRAVGGAWGAIELLAEQASQSGALKVGVDASGAAAASWDDAYAVKLARRSIRAGWSVPVTLASAPGRVYAATGPFSAYMPDIAVNATGDLIVAWLEADVLSGTWSVEADVQPATSPAFHANWLADTTGGLPTPRVALNDGQALAVCAWVDNGANTAYAATASVGTATWSTPFALGPAVWDTSVSVAAGTGGANAVWLNGNVTRFSWQFRASTYR